MPTQQLEEQLLEHVPLPEVGWEGRHDRLLAARELVMPAEEAEAPHGDLA